ncbi:MAG TPA: nodulation protein NfeD [Dehalococcoidia bacterium]|nr:nodulation protein NfeD [Dehalococcoidia bacterium]
MVKIIRLLLLVGLLVTAFIAIEAQAASSKIDVLHVEGTINPVLVDYIERGIAQAEEDNTIACIIQMDTPGGLDTSMRLIIQDILNAKVPVVVYIPSGARAASAGFFITIAAHVAVMAPGTEIGAAHPVAMSSEGEAAMSEAMEEKIVNDAAAYAISIANTHGRNAEWAEKAVREAASLPSHQALELNVIDMIAPNLDALISQLDDRQVTMLDGSTVTLRTQGATVNHVNMTVIEDFLYAISDPNIAYILLSLAMLGIMVEIFNPGLIFPGVVGGICGLLAFYSLGMLPVNYAGVLLIVLAFGLFIAEVFTTTFGLFTAGGLTSLVIGSLILFKGGPLFQLNPWLIATVSICIAALFAFVINRIIKAHRHQATTGREELVGKTAIVKIALEPEGIVFFRGERWIAVSEKGRVEPGEEVIITKVDGLKLYVTRKDGGGK